MRKTLLIGRRRGMLPLAVFGVIAAVLVSCVVVAVAATEKAGSVKSVVVSTRKPPKLGTVLVDAEGHTLYMCLPDRHGKVTCTGGCAVAWPALKLPSGAKAVAKRAGESEAAWE